MKTNVTGISNKGVKIGSTTVRTELIIGADGIESVVGHWAGLDTTLALADIGICSKYVVSDFEHDHHKVEMYWGDKIVSGCGYAWVFPRGDGSANVGLGVAGVHVPKTGTRPVLDEFVKFRCGKNCNKSNHQVGSIPQSSPMTTAVSGNVILVGDAARFTIPLTGSGIGHALYSGALAVETILEMREKGAGLDYLKTYDARWRARLVRKLKRAYKLKERFRQDRNAIERMFRILKPFVILHRMFPSVVEKLALRDFRY
ncbi:MAG: NAD(P)/FAD-dependent oxidoreductase [Thermoplasmata archaeon]|nr:MAG: NAD(P)/FAD-dependent oxidoreductase [Thermoplasmata archaeon]